MRYENLDPNDDHPIVEQLDPGVYSWCRCGRTKDVPWCDGSHEGTGYLPLDFEAKGDRDMPSVCNCGMTGTQPWCDGTHKTEGL